jgi:putative transcriptional regulator
MVQSSARSSSSENGPQGEPVRHTAAPKAAASLGEADGLLTGQLLIAMPAMNTPHFNQAVIYLCAHTPEGAMGIVLNRPLSTPSFDDLLQQLDVAPVPPVRRIELCRGGPVDNARGFVLHTADWTGDGSLVVDDHVALTASLDVLKAIADGGGPARGFLALGYAGWGPGQLDQEMQANAWLSAPASVDLMFDKEHGTKWRRAMAILKVDPILLSDTAGHA